LTAGGGITKTLGKSKLPNSALSRTLANKPQSRPQQKETVAFDVQADLDLAESTHCGAGLPASANVSICSTAPGPVAERLLRYGHNLESTFGQVVLVQTADGADDDIAPNDKIIDFPTPQNSTRATDVKNFRQSRMMLGVKTPHQPTIGPTAPNH